MTASFAPAAMLARLAVVILVGLALLLPAAAAGYKLGAGDRIRIDIVGEPSLSGEAMLQADGAIRLPRVGSIALDGLTLAEAETAVATRLKSGLGLADPEITIAVAGYRPIFIVGDVQSPGAYAFSPGMTVLHAIALAGGYHRAEPGDAAARLEAGRLLERKDQLFDQIAISYVRLARYEAERDGVSSIQPSSAATALVTPERLATLVAQERAILDERAVSLAASLKTFDQRREQLNNEIAALGAQRDAKMQQADNLRREQDSIKDLIEKGLIPSPRVFELQRTIIGTDADVREIEAYISRAKREIVLADQGELNLKSDRRLDILNGIKGARDEVAQQQLAISAVAAQIAVAEGITRGQSNLPDNAGLSFDHPMVKRHGQDDFVAIGLTDPLQPDDLVAIPVNQPRSRVVRAAAP